MTRLSLTLIVLSVAPAVVIGAPRRDKPAPPITADNVNKLQPIGEIIREVVELAWGPTPGELAVMAWERPIEVLDDNTLQRTRTLLDKKKLVHFSLSRDRELLASSVNGAQVELLDLGTGKKLEIDAGQSQPSLTFTPDGKFLATGGYGKQAKLWDTATGKLVRSFDTDTDGGLTIAFNPDGKLLALGNRNSDARVFETATGKLLHTLPKRMSHELRFNPSVNMLAVTYVDGGVSIWDPATGKLLHATETGAKETYTLDWSPKGDLLVTAGREGKIVIWDANGLKPLKELEMAAWVIKVRFSPDGDKLFAAGGTGNAGSPDRRLMVWGLPER